MPELSLKDLRDAASVAHSSGDTQVAIGLFQEILDRFPNTPEAGEAAFYLSSIGDPQRRRPTAPVSPEKKKGPPENGHAG